MALHGVTSCAHLAELLLVLLIALLFAQYENPEPQPTTKELPMWVTVTAVILVLIVAGEVQH